MREIHLVSVILLVQGFDILGLIDAEKLFPFYKIFYYLIKFPYRIDVYPRHIFQFIDILLRHEKMLVAVVHSADHRRQQSVHSLDAAVETQLSEKQELDLRYSDLVFENQEKYRDRHRQIKTRPHFPDVRGREIEDDFPAGQLDARIAERSSQALFWLFDGGIRQSDDLDGGQWFAGIRLHDNLVSFQSDIGIGFHFLNHNNQLTTKN